jgi:hypothetical protein
MGFWGTGSVGKGRSVTAAASRETTLARALGSKGEEATGSARTLGHHLCSQVSDQGNPTSRAGGVQGHRGDLLGA